MLPHQYRCSFKCRISSNTSLWQASSSNGGREPGADLQLEQSNVGVVSGDEVKVGMNDGSLYLDVSLPIGMCLEIKIFYKSLKRLEFDLIFRMGTA